MSETRRPPHLPLVMLLLLSWALALPLAPSHAAAAEGFAFDLDVFEVTGSGAFFDDFRDLQRDVPPTAHLVGRHGTTLTEVFDFLRFSTDDGAGTTADPESFRDEVISTLPIQQGTGQTEIVAIWRAGAPTIPGSGYGASLVELDNTSGAVTAGFELGVFALSGGERFFATLPAPCQVLGMPVVVLVGADDVALGCDLPSPASFAFDMQILFRLDPTARTARVFYSLDGGGFFLPGNEWLAPVLNPILLFQADFRTYPGAFAQGPARAAYQSHSLANEILTTPAGAITALAGDLRESGSTTLGPLTPSGPLVPGSFVAASAGAGDLRLTPGSVTAVLAGASFGAVAERPNGVRRVDPSSGRPIKADAPPGATCATGAQPACLTSTAPIAASADAFAALCRWTRGSSPADPAACRLDLFSSQAPALGITLARAFGIVLAGQPGFSTTMAVLLGGLAGSPAATALLGGGIGGTPLLVPLHADAGDAGGGFTLGGRLTPAQQALLGCGPYLGTSCQDGGLRLLAVSGVPIAAGAEAAALLQSFPGGGGQVASGFLTTSGAQPGTTTGPAPQPAARDVSGTPVWLPGARGPGDPGYAVAQDGDPSGAKHPFTGAPFRSELALLSWNLVVLLVVQSPPALPGAPTRAELDPAQPLRTDGCSFAAPQHCHALLSLLSNAAILRSDDPRGSPRLRWVWETGAQYGVNAGSGAGGIFRGGHLHLFGPFAATTSDHAAASALLLEPRALADADADGIADAEDDCAANADAAQRDSDGDGVGDACDDCPYAADPGQIDRGGVGAGSAPDGIGDACQCGDVSGDGRVTLTDALLVRRSLLAPPTATPARPELCDVGAAAGCSLSDALVIQRAQLSPPIATIVPQCDPATP